MCEFGVRILSISFAAILGLLCTPAVRAQYVYSQWLSATAGTAAESALAVAPALAEATNVYVLGGFSSPTTIGGVTLSNLASSPDIFLAKFRFQAAGPPLWTRAPLSDGPVANATAIADYNGDCYIGGSFTGTNLTLGATTLTNHGPGSDDVFLAKYNTYGALQWVRQLGGAAADSLAGLAGGQVFSANGFFITGGFQSPSFAAGGTTLIRQGTGTDCFTASYDFNGNLLWLKQGSNARSTCLSVDTANNCYVGGQLLGNAVFDTETPANPTGTNFLLKYDASGNLQWVRGDVTVGNCLKVDYANNIYTAGTFSNFLTVGSVTFSNQSPSTIFVIKYDGAGNLLWATQLPGGGCDGVSGITFDLWGNCWVSGYFASATENGQPVAPRAAMLCLQPDGKVLDIVQGPATGASRAAALGNLYDPMRGVPEDAFVCGSFSTNFSLGSLALTNNGVPDVFVGWFIAPPAFTTAATQTNLVISWPVGGSQSFTLQSAPDLKGGTWTTATNLIYFVNGQHVITNSTTSGSAFFRLRSSP